jgi:hypothetical protein
LLARHVHRAGCNLPALLPPEEERMASIDKTKATPQPPLGQPDQLRDREYGHSSGDRNTRTDERDWKHFKDGEEHTEHVDSGDDSDEPNRPV